MFASRPFWVRGFEVYKSEKMEIRILDGALEKFICNLEKTTIAKTLRVLDLLEEFGDKPGMPHSKRMANDLLELRISGK